MVFTPGERLESRCTKCKDVMGHIIVLVLEDKIAKVECCACGSVHKYYPPAQKKESKDAKALRVRAGEERTDAVKEKVAKTSRTSTSSPAKKASITKAGKLSAKNAEELQLKWQKAIASNPSKPIPYSMTVELVLANVVDHSVFGIGMVIESFPPNKVDILFEEGIKSLRCQCS